MTTAAPPVFRLSWPVPTYLALAVAGLFAQLFVPLPWLGSPAADLLMPIGMIVAVAGLALVGAALAIMRRVGTTVLPEHQSTHLVTNGPFAISRNPIYVGFAAIVVAAGLLLGNLWLFAAALLASLIVDRLVIRREEEMLSARFGKKYRDYARKVRRWL